MQNVERWRASSCPVPSSPPQLSLSGIRAVAAKPAKPYTPAMGDSVTRGEAARILRISVDGVRKLEERGVIRRVGGTGPIRYAREAIEALHSSRLAPDHDEVGAAAAPTLRRLDARADEAEAAAARQASADAFHEWQQRLQAENERQQAELARASARLDGFALRRRWGLDRESWLVVRNILAEQSGERWSWYPEQVAAFEHQCRYAASFSPVGMPADKLRVWQVCREIALRAPLPPGELPPTVAPLPAPPPEERCDPLVALLKVALAFGGAAAFESRRARRDPATSTFRRVTWRHPVERYALRHEHRANPPQEGQEAAQGC